MSDGEKPFDLSQYEMADSFTFKVKNIQGDDYLIVGGQPVLCEVWSTGSKQGVRALHLAGLASQMRTMRMLRGELDKDDVVKADAERAAKLAAFTKSISTNFAAAPETITSNPKMNWFTKQIKEAVSKDANFSKGSTPS